MKKEKIVTVFALFTAFSVVVGGWFIVVEMLNRKEVEIRNRKGIAYELDSELAASKNNEERNPSDPETFAGTPVSSDEMAMVLTVWGNSAVEIPHEPENGQMTMNQAMTAGADWINAMAEKGILPAFLSECGFERIHAKLCTVEQNPFMDELLLSFWQVIYKEEDIRIVLKIHAAGGQVWRAEVSMDESRGNFDAYTDDELLAAAFPFIDMEDRMICAKIKRDFVKINDTAPVERLILWLDIKTE